jgi:hypothetical protein
MPSVILKRSYAYATEDELGTMNEERIGVHRRKAMLHHLLHPNRKLLPVPYPLETGSQMPTTPAGSARR